MERKVTFRNSRGLTLVGLFTRGDTGKAVIMAHGFTSDKSSRGRFDRISAVLAAQGYSTLRFDFSGCGESDDDTLSIEKEVEDLRSAVDFVRAQGCTAVALYGHSLGSLICLRSASTAFSGTGAPKIATMVLTGAFTGPMHYDWTSYYSLDELRELFATGCMATATESVWRKAVRIEKQLLDGFAQVDQEQLLRPVTCPVLIIHGNNPDGHNPVDEEECLLLANSQRGMPLLPAGSRLEIIGGAGHSFEGYLDRVIELACAWLGAHT